MSLGQARSSVDAPSPRREEISKLRSSVSSQRSITTPNSRSFFRFHVPHHFVVGPSMLDGTQRIHCVSVKPSLTAFSTTEVESLPNLRLVAFADLRHEVLGLPHRHGTSEVPYEHVDAPIAGIRCNHLDHTEDGQLGPVGRSSLRSPDGHRAHWPALDAPRI